MASNEKRSAGSDRSGPSLSPHQAPGRLRPIQAFVNTFDPHTDTDELTSPDGLRAWLAHWRLAPADAAISEGDWRNALEIREGWRAMLRAHNGAKLDAEALERLNRALGVTRPRLRFETDTSIRLEPTEPGWPGALGRLLDAIVEAMISGRWIRLKACHEDQCQMAFYDASRNRMGKWCAIRRCGNRIHAKTYRRRGPTWWRGYPPHRQG